MKPKDPQIVACPHCSTTSTQRVAELLALKATCPKCSGSLADAGLKMRRAYDDWSTYVIAMELTFALEKVLDCRLDDEGLEGEDTARCDLVCWPNQGSHRSQGNGRSCSTSAT
jgi:hypothetical protein